MRLLRLALVFAAGVAAGWWLAHTRATAPAPAPAASPPSVTHAAPVPEQAAPVPWDAVVHVDLFDAAGNRTHSTTGVIAGDAAALILPLAGIEEADRAVFTDGSGTRHALGAVIGADGEAGLAALEIGATAVAGIAIGAGNDRLYLGRELLLATPDGVSPAAISSAALAGPSGVLGYEVTHRARRPLASAMLIDAQSGLLVGVAQRAPDGEQLVAVDVGVLGALLEGLDAAHGQRLDAFLRDYHATSVSARVARLYRLRASGDDAAVAAQGGALLRTQPGLADVIIGLMEEAWQRLARDYLRQGRPAEAVALLEEAARLYPDSDARQHLRAQACQTLGLEQYEAGRYADALSNLSRALELEPGLAARIAPVLASARQRIRLPALAEVPVRASGNVLFVDAHVNGAPGTLRMVLDTGASYTAISTDAARRFGVRVTRDTPVVSLSTANGLVQAPLVRVASVGLAGVSVSDVEVVILDSIGEFDGLLGLSFLDHFNIDLDRQTHVMRLRRR